MWYTYDIVDEKHIYEILNLAEDEVDAVSDAHVVPRASEDESEEHFVSRPSRSRERATKNSKSSGKKKARDAAVRKEASGNRTAAKKAALQTTDARKSEETAADTGAGETGASVRPKKPASASGDVLPIIDGVPVERRKKTRVKPDPEYDLRYPDYTLLLTKGLTNTVVKRIYLAHKKGQALLLSSFLLGVLVLCFIVYAVIHMVFSGRRLSERNAEIASLRTQNETLAADNAELRNRVTRLSVSVNRNIEDRRAQEAADEEALLPKGFPLSQYAEYTLLTEEELSARFRAEEGGEDATDGEEEEDTGAEDAGQEDSSDEEAPDGEDAENENTDGENADGENTEGEENDADGQLPEREAAPVLVAHFESPVGSRILASGGGVVTRVIEDDLYGTLVVVDHRNGYTSLYRNRGEAAHQPGDTVRRGDTLFQIGEENTKFGYQIRFNEENLDPSELIRIGG